MQLTINPPLTYNPERKTAQGGIPVKEAQGRIFDSAEALIGGTPLMEIKRIAEKLSLPARILVKLERMNPGGSVKDRAALFMISEAEKQGILKKGSVIIEPTSGNTGVGLALIGALRGYRAVIVMPDSMSRERQLLMTAYGAELVLTPGALGMKGAIEKAEELARQIPGSFIPDQFNNAANALAHYRTTGPEIWQDTAGQVDLFVAGAGTGGTVTGVGRYLKEQCPAIRIIAAEPQESPVLSGGKAGPHDIQGIGAGFVPGVLDLQVVDEVIPIRTEDAFAAARLLGRTEGLLCGISSGAALHAALILGQRPENAGKTIVALLPDTGERYLSTGLFDA
ncbi:MAG: cysteine synthase A [Clostridia bacterium]|nr:cysteine synthase A [Clostridia bacterium]